ncbi:rhodanese-like domain-containing protein [uncultured Litoreibacter sp.]|uniref:rhodanese-like domain-containing protein n=1 Tax=uncultured Litoreibacter sp. TaxID=1392394 RepID=UPI002635F2FD|nr:rhodanese-like domain-containing protein [uncultured Litoreibacter sp.]
MSTDDGSRVLELSPAETWDLLKQNSDAVLVDVRSKPEWGFVGIPDVSTLGHETVFVEWASFPGMSANAGFADEVLDALGGTTPSAMLFLCRSGVRSIGAARAMTAAFEKQGVTVKCISVAEGFEGDLNSHKQRGGLNGWKARGLPWLQS